RRAEVGVVILWCVRDAGLEAEVVERAAVLTAVEYGQGEAVAPRPLPVVVVSRIEQEDRGIALRRRRLDLVVVRPEHRTPLEGVGRRARASAILRVHAVPVRDEGPLAVLHAENLRLVAGRVALQA